jgi:CubicO group peptidase (beta-lactamase class C family)
MRYVSFVKSFFTITAGIVFVAGLSTCKKGSVPDPVSAGNMAEFEARLDHLRKEAHIPGMVAGIIKDGQIVWTNTYGYADLQNNKAVTDSTIFHLASLTKTFASVVVMQLVKENKINLTTPVADYGINLPQKDTVRVIHLLTHTSEGVPGSTYQYNGDRYALLSAVMEAATGETFGKLAYERIIRPLGLQSTAPSDRRLAHSFGYDTLRIHQNTAHGYLSNGAQPVDYPKGFSAAAGLTSSMNDMLQYAAAFDGAFLLTEDLKAKVFTPMVSNEGHALPYGLGWFIQQKEGIKLAWHYGYWVGMSSLMIRVPEKRLSFVLMANSDMLSAPYPLGGGDIWASPYAKEFLKSFVLAGAKL